MGQVWEMREFGNLHLEVKGKEWLREDKESPKELLCDIGQIFREGISLEIFLQMKGSGEG